MPIYLKDFILLIIMISAGVLAQQYNTVTGCPTGRFGHNCRFKCHCSISTECDIVSGACPYNEACALPYFGTECQYVDIVALDFVSYVPLFLRDRDDTSCNPLTDDSSVEMIFKSKTSFSLIRIVTLSNMYSLAKTIRVLIGNYTGCLNEMIYILDNSTVDVMCDTARPELRVRIEGKIAGMICSIYVSPGFNTAIGEETRQTSNYEDDYTFCWSNNAVDGITSSNYDDHSCAQTSSEDDRPEWFLTFLYPVKLNYIQVYTRRDAFPLTGCTISTGNEYGNTSFSHIVQGTEIVHKVFTDNTIFVKSLNVSNHSPLESIVLALCEVETYGYYVCPDGTYGISCDHLCNCTVLELCSFVTGACAKACPDGYYGSQCLYRCSNNCLSDVCTFKMGHCLSCIPGYSGKHCNISCPPGTFGSGCTNRCSNICMGKCNPENGTCICDDSYTGPNCKDCRPGLYGTECNLTCSDGCSNICNSVNGNCVCKDGYDGLLCTECGQGRYGKPCINLCSVGCTDTCNTTTGHCRCKENYSGLLCTECKTGKYGTYCQHDCSTGCHDNCNPSNGKCSCKADYQGDYCIECIQGKYGSQCDQNCSKGCAGGICNSVHGYCMCSENYYGLLCTGCRYGKYGKACALNCSEGCDDVCNNVNGECLCRKDYKGPLCLEHCPEGTKKCTKKCMCKPNEVCAVTTGQCTGTCENGFYGDDCSRACSVACNYMGCDQLSGTCKECFPGYYGTFCNRVCNPGTYGPGCLLKCSSNCRNICSRFSGKCSCKNNFAGSTCTECIDRMFGASCTIPCSKKCKGNCSRASGYCESCFGNMRGPYCEECLYENGENCTPKCSALCYKSLCNMDTGECESCIGRRIGPKCENCPTHYYGPICETSCSADCKDGICDQESGHCLACSGGATGSHCQHGPDTSYYWLVWCAPLVLGVAFIGYFVCSRRQSFVHRLDNKECSDRHTKSTTASTSS